MAIVVEDGSGVTGANSYVTTAELTTFASDRDVTLSGTLTNEQLLILAMDYIESMNYKGYKVSYSQALQWPRSNVYIDGYYNTDSTIPNDLKKAQMQTALAIDAGNSPQQVIARKTIREKVGELEVQYSEGSVTSPVDGKITSFLYKLLAAGGQGSANTRGSKA